MEYLDKVKAQLKTMSLEEKDMDINAGKIDFQLQNRMIF